MPILGRSLLYVQSHLIALVPATLSRLIAFATIHPLAKSGLANFSDRFSMKYCLRSCFANLSVSFVPGVSFPFAPSQYARVADLMNVLLDEIRDDETHLLSDVLHYLTVQMEAYAVEHVEIPEVEPKAVLRFLME
jgi:hypothetical protein